MAGNELFVCLKSKGIGISLLSHACSLFLRLQSKDRNSGEMKFQICASGNLKYRTYMQYTFLPAPSSVHIARWQMAGSGCCCVCVWVCICVYREIAERRESIIMPFFFICEEKIMPFLLSCTYPHTLRTPSSQIKCLWFGYWAERHLSPRAGPITQPQFRSHLPHHHDSPQESLEDDSSSLRKVTGQWLTFYGT